MNPWWLRPPADEGPSGDEKSKKTGSKAAAPRSSAKTGGRKPSKPTEKKAAGGQPSKPTEKKADDGRRRSRRGRGGNRGRGVGGGSRNSTQPLKVALFCDIDSIDRSLEASHLNTFELEPLLVRLAEIGQVEVKRAYGDLQRHAELVESFQVKDLETIDTGAAGPGNQGSAVSIAVDAMDLCLSKRSIDTLVLVADGSTVLPLISKLREHKKDVVGVGARSAVSDKIAQSFDRYLDYEEWVRQSPQVTGAESAEPSKEPIFSLLAETIQSLGEGGEGIIWGSTLKREMHLRDPDFSEGSLGYSTFSDLLEDADRHQVIQLERDDRSGNYYVSSLARE